MIGDYPGDYSDGYATYPHHPQENERCTSSGVDPSLADEVVAIGAAVPAEAWEAEGKAVTVNADGSVTIGSRARLAEMLNIAAHAGWLSMCVGNMTDDKCVDVAVECGGPVFSRAIAAAILRREGL